MIEKILTVQNRAGIHARPAAIIAQTSNKFESEIMLSKDDATVNAKSIMGVLSLGLAKPLDLTIHCSENVEPILDAIQPYVVSAE